MKSFQLAAWLLIVALLVYVLIIGKQLIIPLVVAISIWFLINTIAEYIQRIPTGRFRIPLWLAFLAAAVIIIAAFALSIDIILANAEKMVLAVPRYEEILDNLIADVMNLLDIEETPSIAMLLDQIDLQPVIVNLGASISNIAGKLILIIIYIIFLLLEQRSFYVKFQAFFSKPGRYQQGLRIMERINSSIKIYLSVKTFVSLLTAGFSYAVMWLMGLDFAAFWAFLIFLLNFIPSIGSIIATGLVSLFALLQFQDLSEFLLILLSVGGIQLAIGNYLDPRLMGKSLNISPLVVLLSLALWGGIWGVIGMVLSVPLMVIIMIILAQFTSTMPLAILLSQDGRILEWDERMDKREKLMDKEVHEGHIEPENTE